MSGLLADVFSFGNTAKRKIKGLLDDPMGSITQYINNENDRAGRFNQLTAEAAREGAQAIKQGKSMVGPKSQQLAGLLADAYNPTGMFIGASAKTWDKAAAEKAQKMLKDGVDPRQVWKETGTFKGADGALRQEIDDSGAAFIKNKLEYPYKDNPDVARTKLSAAMGHQPLYAAYPSSGSIDVVVNPKMGATRGSYHEANAAIDLPEYLQIGLDRQGRYETAKDWLASLKNPNDPDFWKSQAKEGFDTGAFGSMKEAKRDAFNYLKSQAKEVDELKNGVLWPSTDSSAKSTTLHEIQHAIQQREGWAKGGSMDDFYNESMRARQGAWDQISAINSELSKAAGTPRYQELLSERQKLVDLAQKDPLDLKEQAYKSYQSLAGEAEARATQARMNMNAAQRREVYPFDSYDVPVDQLIIRGGLLSN